MRRQIPLLLALLAVLLGPILLRPRQASAPQAGEQTVVIITPHNEAIRSEFGRGFAEHYLARTGQRVRVDWRTPGGTSEIGRYVASEYLSSFQNYWENTLRRPWSKLVETSFADARIKPAATPAEDTPQQQARRAFLESTVSCKIDLFFGGGAFDFNQQAAAGRLVDSGFIRQHPELFRDGHIPQTLGGEPFWDREGRWIGTVISSFGICYNPDALARLGIVEPPTRWADLADPRYRGGIALANPMQSSSVNRAFEMLIQQQIQERMKDEGGRMKKMVGEGIGEGRMKDEGGRMKKMEGEGIQEGRMKDEPSGARSPAAGSPQGPSGGEEQRGRMKKMEGEGAGDDDALLLTAEGWQRGMRLLMKIGANARYFTDSSSKIALDVESGEAAAGMCIDFFGRFQNEAVRKPDGTSRLQYTNAVGGTSVSVDPIGLFRGAPHAETGREFIAYVMSPEGQKLWNWKVGTPGGPRRYALRRLPILPALYAPEFAPLRSDPEVAPYDLGRSFHYNAAWTGRLFGPIAFIFRVMCIDSHEELKAAWDALREAGFPPEAMAIFEDVSAVDYAAASGRIRETLSADKIREVQLARELADQFRAQYRHAAETAQRRR